jgi:hypothetical protein
MENIHGTMNLIGEILRVLAAGRSRMRARLPADANGGITSNARANAVKGRVPK